MTTIPSENDEAMQFLFAEGGFMPKASQPLTVPEDIRIMIRRWRDLVETRAYKYMDGRGDLLGRLMLDEVAAVDAWLKEQEGEVQSYYSTATTTDQSPGLTLDAIIAALPQIEALLPGVHYVTSAYAPLTNSDGSMACMWISGRKNLDAFGAHQGVETLVIIHTDNLPDFQRQCKGRCRLVPLEGV